MKSIFEEYRAQLCSPMTVEEDTAFYIAAYSEKEELLQRFIDLVESPSNLFNALNKKNKHGNNTFHEVAITDRVKTAEFLVKKLQKVYRPDEGKLQKLLMDENNLGETPIYRAVALGLPSQFEDDDVSDDGNEAQIPSSDQINTFFVFLHLYAIMLQTKYSIQSAAILIKRYRAMWRTIAKAKERNCFKIWFSYYIPASSNLFEALKKKNKHGSNTFHEVATTNEVETARFLVTKLQEVYRQDEDKLEELLTAKTTRGETPIYRAVAHGQPKMAKYLATKVRDLSCHFEREDQMSILHIAVIGQHFDTALWVLRKGKVPAKEGEFENKEEASGLTCLHLLAKMPHVFRSYPESSRMGELKKFLYYSTFKKEIFSKYRATWKCLAKGWPAIDKLWETKRKHKSASKLTNLLAKADLTWENSCEVGNERKISLGKEKERGLQATSNGIVEIFDVIIEKHPQAIEYISDDEENVLHVCIAHRRRDIFRRVKKMEVIMKCRLVSRIDKNGYTLLHHVADMKYYEGREQAGPAFQLQEELKWLQRVRKIIPSHYEIHRNNDNMTADELFQETHSQQLKNAQKWIKETSQSCSAVAVLVATVVFTAAYTVPGGNDPSGRPNFIDSPFFMLFTVMDIVSLACSLTSVVMFLSILSSPFEYENFRTALPRKLLIGFTLLFFSVTTTMLSLAATIFLLLHFQKKAWTNTVIYTAAFLPVSMFALMQFPLYAAFSKTLHTLFKKIMKKAVPQKFIPHYLRSKKRKIY
nr:isoform 2 of ankyrin repeat-containing protein npr4 [Quercus suber]